MQDELRFAQLPHPGREHRPKGRFMPWNKGEHARKFVRSEGTYLADGQVRSGPVTFWTEWEANSEVVATWPAHGRMPRYLHEPFIPDPLPRGWRQNTDPLVFGDRFVYTNCKMARSRKLRTLAPASVILFGSGTKAGFILDTVLVVDDDPAPHYTPADSRKLGCDDELRALVFDTFRGNKAAAASPLRFYRGATHGRPILSMFSFVPCRPETDDEPRFERPVIELEGLIHPKLFMGVRCSTVTAENAAEAWQRVVEQIKNRGLALGVHFPFPPVASHEVADGGDAEQPPVKLGLPPPPAAPAPRRR